MASAFFWTLFLIFLQNLDYWKTLLTEMTGERERKIDLAGGIALALDRKNYRSLPAEPAFKPLSDWQSSHWVHSLYQNVILMCRWLFWLNIRHTPVHMWFYRSWQAQDHLSTLEWYQYLNTRRLASLVMSPILAFP